jgi:hypothetical protein
MNDLPRVVTPAAIKKGAKVPVSTTAGQEIKCVEDLQLQELAAVETLLEVLVTNQTLVCPLIQGP